MIWMTLGRGSAPLWGSEATVIGIVTKNESESWRMLVDVDPMLVYFEWLAALAGVAGGWTAAGDRRRPGHAFSPAD